MYEESENEIYFNVCLLKVAACVFEFFQYQKKINSLKLTNAVQVMCKQVFMNVSTHLLQNLSKQLMFTLQ